MNSKFDKNTKEHSWLDIALLFTTFLRIKCTNLNKNFNPYNKFYERECMLNVKIKDLTLTKISLNSFFC